MERSTIGMHFGKKLSAFPKNYSRSTALLCVECYETLMETNEECMNDWKNCWAAFLWKFFQSLDSEEDLILMWSLLPLTFRSYWYTSYRQLCEKQHIIIDLNNIPTSFVDVSEKGDHIDMLNASGKLVDLMESCNLNCYCSVMCPWGCTEFIDDCGYIPFFRVLMLKFPHRKLPLSYKSIHIKQYNKHHRTISDVFVGIRSDYFNDGYYFMDNNKWKVQASVRIVKGKGLFICTCKEHDGGSLVSYLHPPRNPMSSIYPSSNGDQLAHAVLKPRVIKTIKCNKYSDSYQMQDCYGGYKGVDSCDIIETGNYSYSNILCNKNISLSLNQRPDIRCRLSQLVQEKIIPMEYEEDKLKMMEQDMNEDMIESVEVALNGSSYISLKDAINMHCSEENTSKLSFNPSWPMFLIQCCTNDNVGFKPYSLPVFQSTKDLRYPWITLSMMTSIPVFWDCLNDTVYLNGSQLCWHGFILDYATKNVISTCGTKYRLGTRSGRKNPYCNKYMNALHLSWKMEFGNQETSNNNIDDVRHYNPCFNVEMFRVILKSIKGVMVYSSLDEMKANALSCDTKLIVIVQDDNITGTEYEQYISEENNNGFAVKLCYIGETTNKTGNGKYNNWGFKGYTNYGVTSNSEKCWKIGRTGDPIYTAKEIIRPQILVYEVTSPQNEMENEHLYKVRYMNYMGYNSKAVCLFHKLPMTTMSTGNGYLCCNVLTSGHACKKAAYVECPCNTCYYKLCKHCCMKQQSSKLQEEVHKTDDCVLFQNLHDTKVTQKENMNTVHSDANMEDEHMVLAEVNYDEESTTTCTSMSVTSAAQDNIKKRYVIPTTNTGRKNVKVKLKQRKSKFGLHVLLNEHCSLLIRRGSQLKPTRAAKGFFERITATSDGKSIPLLYPEAMMFPSIFWKQRNDGSYPGALPLGLWTNTGEAHSLGFAGVGEHMRSRLKNTSLLCSTDPRYIYFAFDAVYNVMSRGVDNRILFKRGFEHMLGPCSMSGQNNDSLLSSDMVDSRRNVQKLAALVRDKEPSYFYTHTCNQSTHFGIAPLREWLMERLDALLQDNSFTDSDFQEMVKAYHIAISTQIIRTWFKVGRMYMNYIISSSEYPLGKIERYWWRWEYQDAMGNLPHIHCLLWTKESKHDSEELKQLQQRIRCSRQTFFNNKEEVEALFNEGLLPNTNADTIMDVLELAELILTHNCANAKYRCMKRVGLGVKDVKCRFVDYFKENPNPSSYGYKRIDPRHRKESLEVLQKLGIFDENGIEQDYRFRAGKYVYPAEEGQLMSPCNPRLFVAHKSSDNLVITDTYFSCRYLAKYVQGLDENCKVQLKAGKEKNEILLQEQHITNTKITSGKIYEEQRQRKMKTNPAYVGRAIGLPEVVGLLLQEQQVFTNASFITIPTVPLEQRPAHEKVKRYSWCSDLRKECSKGGVAIGQGTRNFLSHRIRQKLQLPQSRQFDAMQQTIIQDALSSPLSLDAITLFSCRPPELSFINSPVLYFKYFTRLPHKPVNRHTGKSTTESLLSDNLLCSGWIDGLDCQILVRPLAIKHILNMPHCKGETLTLFQILSYICFGNYIQSTMSDNIFPQLDTYKSMFIDSKYGMTEELPFPLFNVVKPTEANRFLIHILLSMGTFKTEGHLFQGHRMTDFFKNASLISLHKEPDEADVIRIVKHFVTEQLLYVPGGTLMFDRYCVAAYDTIKSALLSETLVCCDVPSFLYTSLLEDANKSTYLTHQEMKSDLVKSLSTLPNIPTVSELMKCTKNEILKWKPEMIQMENQTDLSYKESVSVCEMTTRAIDVYRTASTCTPKCILICGGPGTGKTFQLRIACAYALSKGLNTTVTAIMAERALYLGGRHLHYLFCIPADNTTNIHKVIDQSIRGLNRNPERLQFLRTLDVMLIDEAGYMSANLLNITDTVLRKIRGKSSFMGGVLVIATIDDQQLPPVKAKPFLISSLIPTSFEMVALEYSVRARTDLLLQRIINISRKLDPCDDDLTEFVRIIIHHCVHVTSWLDDKIMQGTVRILGTKKAVLKAEKDYYKKISDQGYKILYREAETTQCSIGSHGNWKTADQKVVDSLDRFVNEVQTLKLHQKMMIEMTYNKVNVWSHSQLGILLDLPEPSHIQLWKPIPIMLAPVGVNNLPEGEVTKNNLISNGWKEVKVGIAPEKEIRLYGRISAKRKQYGFKPRIAITVHKALGGDFGSVATSVVSSHDGDNCLLWLKEQVEVLISRTHDTKHLIFVGDPRETAQNLVQLLFKVSPFCSYMRHLVKQMTTKHPTDCVIQPLKYLPYNVRDCILPAKHVGVVYLLLSLQDHNTTYIGETENMKKRLHQHNSGIGSIVTTPISLRPWHPIAFITGFDVKEVRERKEIEKLWHQRKNSAGKSSQNIIDVLQMGKSIVAQQNESIHLSLKLKFIQCIEFKG